jgi:hypothetical protein
MESMFVDCGSITALSAMKKPHPGGMFDARHSGHEFAGVYSTEESHDLI